jgi:hypothetical protein
MGVGMHCPHCQQEHPDDVRFCPVTGQMLAQMVACSYCGREMPANATFCPHCGKGIRKPIGWPVFAVVGMGGLVLFCGVLILVIFYFLPTIPGVPSLPDLFPGTFSKTAVSSSTRASLETHTPEPSATKPATTVTITATSVPPTITPRPTKSPTPTRPVTSTPSRPTETIIPVKWSTQVVDNYTQGGQFSFLVFDSKDIPMIAYLDDKHDKLKFATKINNRWNPVTLPDNRRAGWYPSIAIDPTGNPYVGYWNFDLKKITYFYQKSGSWRAGTSIANVRPSSTAFAFDAQGRLNVAFLDKNDGDVKFAVLQSGNWIRNTIAFAYPDPDTIPDEGANVTMAIGQNGTVHLAFNTASKGLTYVLVQGDTSLPEYIDPQGGQFPSLTLSPEGKPVISYYEPSLHCLKVARKMDTGWSIQIVDDGGDVGRYSSVKVDAIGALHISYYDSDSEALKYARVATSRTDIYFVDRNRSGKWSSLALDSRGMPGISYYDDGRLMLKYAWASAEK